MILDSSSYGDLEDLAFRSVDRAVHSQAASSVTPTLLHQVYATTLSMARYSSPTFTDVRLYAAADAGGL